MAQRSQDPLLGNDDEALGVLGRKELLDLQRALRDAHLVDETGKQCRTAISGVATDLDWIGRG